MMLDCQGMRGVEASGARSRAAAGRDRSRKIFRRGFFNL
jgi:hypothetical protein